MRENIEIIKNILADKDESGQYNPDDVTKIIEMFIKQEDDIKKEMIVMITEYFEHIQKPNYKTGKLMKIPLNEMASDLIKIIKSKTHITTYL